MLVTCGVFLTAYLVGGIPFGYLVARARGINIFKHGSGNIGATNVARALGKPFGILVFLLDCAKGAGPTGLAGLWKTSLLGSTEEWPGPGFLEVSAGLAAFLGHLFPPYLGFRGGKGVATGAGAVAVLAPGPALGALLAWGGVLLAFRLVSQASLAAAAVLCLVHLVMTAPPDGTNPRTLFCLLASALVWWRHRANMVRLWRGTEPRLGDHSTLEAQV